MPSINRLCVYCASNPGRDPAFAAAAAELGALLADRRIGVVYGGGSVGLMGVLADSVLAAGGDIIGVIPHHLEDREVGHAGLTEKHVVASMHERKQLMADLADGFVALPGGFGTLEEVFEVLTWSQLGLHRKPIGLLDVAEFYTPLLAFLDHAVDVGLLRPQHRASIVPIDGVADVIEALEAWSPPPDLPKWIERPPR